jgi:hypothetical protein
MRIGFFDDPLQSPRKPEDVRINRLGIFVYEDGRRVAGGFDLTPFRRRPSVEVKIRNERGEPAGDLSIIEALQPNFTLTVHLRDGEPTEWYTARAVVYYNVMSDEDREAAARQNEPETDPAASPEAAAPPPKEVLPTGRMEVDERTVRFNATEPGDQTEMSESE